MKIGYARVSTGNQNLDMQMDALKKIECDEIFTDKISGARNDRVWLALTATLNYTRITLVLLRTIKWGSYKFY